MFLLRNSLFSVSLGFLTLVMAVGMQVLPSADFAFDKEMTELFDVEESEEEKNEKDEKEKDQKLTAQHLAEMSKGYSSFCSKYNFDHGIPSPPCIETLVPPPDRA